MAYKPILEKAHLPPAGQAFPEHLRLDLKTEVPNPILAGAADPDDIACDIAAFANATGGVVLVGAHEQPIGTLHVYVPMTQADAQRVVTIAQDARTLCSPQPVIDPRPIELTAGQYVVAINVDAYAAPPIGVILKSEKGGGKRWAFPARRGDQNRNLRPEELATIMDAEFRRRMLRLLAILTPQGKQYPSPVLLYSTGEYVTWDLVKVDQEFGTVLFEKPQLPGEAPLAGSPLQVSIPIDSMLYFWADPSDGLFRIRIDGRPHVQDGKLHFWPAGPN